MEIYYTFAISAWIYIIVLHGRKFPYSDNYFWSNKIIFEKKYHFNEKEREINKQVCVLLPARNESKTITKNRIKKKFKIIEKSIETLIFSNSFIN